MEKLILECGGSGGSGGGDNDFPWEKIPHLFSDQKKQSIHRAYIKIHRIVVVVVVVCCSVRFEFFCQKKL